MKGVQTISISNGALIVSYVGGRINVVSYEHVPEEVTEVISKLAEFAAVYNTFGEDL